MKAKPTFDSNYAAATSRALANAARYGQPYYVRPTADNPDQFCVSPVRPDRYTVKAIPKLHNPSEAELRNEENWPVNA